MMAEALKILLAAAAIVANLALPAQAGTVCSPRDNTARILTAPTPNAIHPDWSGENYLGMSWSLAVKKTKKAATGTYLSGNLYSPRGGLINKDIYVVAKEWNCRKE